jgi:hypothetical protein
MSEIIRMISDVHKVNENGKKYYQAMIGIGWPIFGNHRILRRKWKTNIEAFKYMVDFFATWARLHK